MVVVRWYRSNATPDHGFETNDERTKVRLLAVTFANRISERALSLRDTNVYAVLTGATTWRFLTLHDVCFLRLGRGDAQMLMLFRLAVNACMSRIGKFLVQRGAALLASALFACSAFNGLRRFRDPKYPCNALNHVA